MPTTQCLQDNINSDFKSAMKNKDAKQRDALQLLRAAIKQREIDSRNTLDDTAIIEILTGMIKQRKESSQQYTQGGRQDLVDQEQFEIKILSNYLPEQLSADAVTQLITTTVTELQATSLRDMGKVMAVLKPKLQGRTDLADVSQQVKSMLSD